MAAHAFRALDGRLDAELASRLQVHAPIGPLTTYRVGGPAARLLRVDNEAELVALAGATAGLDLAVLVIGKGSNLLVTDAGFEGLVVVLGEGFDHVEVGSRPDDAGAVHAGAAASLPVVARRTAAAGLTGFEWAVGVPGSVGGAVRMNAGGHGSDLAETLTRVRVVDLASGEDGVVEAGSLALGYRTSAVTPSQVIAWAELTLDPGDRTTSEAEIREIVGWRRDNQPGGRNAGSVFANPPGDSAGRLIDAAGCKGLRIGTAEVSPKHANFIQADPDGRADDVRAVLVEVRRRVFVHSGIELRPENRLIGFAPLPEVQGQ
jgi:UDP-N-acetylmuramate dehydrogenase